MTERDGLWHFTNFKAVLEAVFLWKLKDMILITTIFFMVTL